jgi:hypothetical protein
MSYRRPELWEEREGERVICFYLVTDMQSQSFLGTHILSRLLICSFDIPRPICYGSGTKML